MSALKARPRLVAATLLVLLTTLLASGGMNSGDGGSELAEAGHFCATGQVASSHPIASSSRNYTGAHTWYDANDLGGTLLMLPAACASTLHGAKESDVGPPELMRVAKTGTALTYAFIGGLAVAFVFLALAELTSLR